MQAISPLLVSPRGTWVFMPCSVLHKREICTALKGQRNKACRHPMRRHRDSDSVCPLLHDAFYLIRMQRPFLGMIAFAKTDKEGCFRRYVLTASSCQVIINDVPNLNRELGQPAFVAFAMLNNGHMIALFHSQITDGQCHRFRATNTCAEQEHDQRIVPFPKRRTTINGI